MAERTIYLDHAATTPLDLRVLDVMLPYFTTEYGNASSIYTLGRHAMQAIDGAREEVADILACRPTEISFTGCGSESDNLAIKGMAFAAQKKGNHIITTPIEHHAVLHTCQYLERFRLQNHLLARGWLSAWSTPMILREQSPIRPFLSPSCTPITKLAPSNLSPKLGASAGPEKYRFHVDAVQAGGSLPLNVAELNADLLSLSAHKFYGPKGVGMLYARQGMRLLPQLQGGSQERGRRAGTENVAGIVGAATALRLAYEELPSVAPRLIALRDRLIEGLLAIPGSSLTGHPTNRLPNNASFCFEGVEGESILLNLDLLSIAASTGSACTSGSVDPSHVLLAIGIPPELAHGSLRLTLGKSNTNADVDAILTSVPAIVEKLRRLGI